MWESRCGSRISTGIYALSFPKSPFHRLLVRQYDSRKRLSWCCFDVVRIRREQFLCKRRDWLDLVKHDRIGSTLEAGGVKINGAAQMTVGTVCSLLNHFRAGGRPRCSSSPWREFHQSCRNRRSRPVQEQTFAKTARSFFKA